jgi:predicted KAP-like P-loop ATPase
MIDWSYLVSRLFTTVASWIDAGNLRNRVYQLEEANEIMRVGLEDIQRMDPEGRMGWYAQQVLNTVDGQE